MNIDAFFLNISKKKQKYTHYTHKIMPKKNKKKKSQRFKPGVAKIGECKRKAPLQHYKKRKNSSKKKQRKGYHTCAFSQLGSRKRRSLLRRVRKQQQQQQQASPTKNKKKKTPNRSSSVARASYKSRNRQLLVQKAKHKSSTAKASSSSKTAQKVYLRIHVDLRLQDGTQINERYYMSLQIPSKYTHVNDKTQFIKNSLLHNKRIRSIIDLCFYLKKIHKKNINIFDSFQVIIRDATKVSAYITNINRR